MIVFSRKGPATLAAVSRMRDALSRRLADLRLSAPVRDDIALAFAEVGNNIVLHGKPKASTLQVQLRLEGARLLLVVTDDGGRFEGFSERLAAAGASGSAWDLSEGGRGLAIVSNALEGIAYAPGPLNELTGFRRIYAHRPRVLIVEDDDAQREMYAAFLSADWEVITAASVGDALVISASVDCDVIVSDLHVGDDDGSTLFTSVGESEHSAGPAFVALSSDEQTDIRRRTLGSGIEFFLSKPVSGPALRESVALALERHAAREARLAHRFTRHVESLWTGAPPADAQGTSIVACGDTAATGGGDIIIPHETPARLRVVLADVMGHGLAAKAWSIALAAAIRALLQRHERAAPGAFLQALNSLVCRDDAFNAALSTLIVFDVLPEGGVSYAAAGHPAPVRLSQGGAVQCAKGGPLLGVLETASYETHHIALAPGERLVLSTDGVDAAEVAAGGRLPEWLLGAAAQADLFETGGRAIRHGAAEHLGAHPSDDWTVIVLGASEDAAPA